MKPTGHQSFQFQVTAAWKEWGRQAAAAQRLGSVSTLIDVALADYARRAGLAPPPPRIAGKAADLDDLNAGRASINEARDDYGYPRLQLPDAADKATGPGPLTAEIKLPWRNIVAFGNDIPELIRQLKDGLDKLPKVQPDQE